MSQDPRARLAERAQALAKPLHEERSGQLSLVTFLRAGQLYGLRLSEVRGGGRMKELTPVPGAPSWLVGAVQYQGQVLSLVDLAQLWGLPLRGVADLPGFLVVAHEGRSLGVLAESLRGVQSAEDLRAYHGPELVGVQEVARVEGALVLVLSAGRLFEDPRLS